MIGEKIFLRALELSDVQTLYVFENDTSIWQVSDTIMPYSSFALEQYVLEAVNTDIYTSKQLRLVICECSNGKPIGLIDLFDFNPKHLRAKVGMLIHTDYRQNGYASEALKLLIDYAFTTLNLHQLSCTLTPDNIGSIKLFQKHGFILTGTKKEWFRLNDNWVDEQIYQLIRK
ncbi:MAG: GNAT family N-acetyltransferase [Bacteroidales bacterium]|jgi:diamine N-acetyltransferase|nr:GNAT family N-acetyltransferase [Bacteroidales bacterium]